MTDRRTLRKCRSCGEYINPEVMPWVAISLTGEESHWHPQCHKEATDE